MTDSTSGNFVKKFYYRNTPSVSGTYQNEAHVMIYLFREHEETV